MEDTTALEGEVLMILSSLADSTFKSCCSKLRSLNITMYPQVHRLASLIVTELTARPNVLQLIVKLCTSLGQEICATITSPFGGIKSTTLLEVIYDGVCNQIQSGLVSESLLILKNFKSKLELAAQSSTASAPEPIDRKKKRPSKSKPPSNSQQAETKQKRRPKPSSPQHLAVADQSEKSPKTRTDTFKIKKNSTQPIVPKKVVPERGQPMFGELTSNPISNKWGSIIPPAESMQPSIGSNWPGLKGAASLSDVSVPDASPWSSSYDPFASKSKPKQTKKETPKTSPFTSIGKPSYHGRFPDPTPFRSARAKDDSLHFYSNALQRPMNFQCQSESNLVSQTPILVNQQAQPMFSSATYQVENLSRSSASTHPAANADCSGAGFENRNGLYDSRASSLSQVQASNPDQIDSQVEDPPTDYDRSREINDLTKMHHQERMARINSLRFTEILSYRDLTYQETHDILQFLLGMDGREKPTLYGLIMHDSSPLAKFIFQVPSHMEYASDETKLSLLGTLYQIHYGLVGFLVPKQRDQYINMYQDSLDKASMCLWGVQSGAGKELADKLSGLKGQSAPVMQQSFENRCFRNLPVEPQIYDVSNPAPRLNGNRIEGGYPDTDTYLDTHFKLLREDFVAGLRQGVKDYKEWRRAQEQSTSNIRFKSDVYLYRDVTLGDIRSRSSDSNNREDTFKPVTIFTKEVTLNPNCPLNRKVLDNERSKHFMHGALVCLSDDHFDQIMLMAVVRDVRRDLRNGVVHITVDLAHHAYVDLQFREMESASSRTYTMLETKTFYVAYSHVLEALQSFSNSQPLPFMNYIVQCEPEIKAPQYLAANPVQLKTRANKVGTRLKSITDLRSWPAANTLELNDSQYQAFQQALTKEFVLIQGPPGTGKTHVGLEIMRTLIGQKNDLRDRLTGPILIVCYTNHALDQFLEGILSFENSLINPKLMLRLGSQCKSQVIQDAQLSMKDKFDDRSMKQAKWKGRNEMHQNRKALDGYESQIGLHRYKDMMESLRRIVMSHDRLLVGDDSKMPETIRKIPSANRKELRKKFDEFAEGLGCEIEDAFFYWLEPEYSDMMRVANSGRFRFEMVARHGYEEGYQQEKKSMENFKRRILDGMQKAMSFEEANKIVLDLIKGKTTLSEMYETARAKWQEQNPRQHQHQHGNPKRFFFSLGWKFYNFFADQFRQQLVKVSREKLEGYDLLYRKWNESSRQAKNEMMKKMMVIGMTTTRAASEQKSLMEIGPPIVIVEEAAEVLESHIIGALSPKCKHLILIGDHQQLRPSTATYRLTKKPFHLDISLFERMVKNQVENVQLKVQHRMRPEVSQFVRLIYPELTDHKSVRGREPIRGLAKPVWFYNHQHQETPHQGTDSKKNDREAEMLVTLCEYLLYNQYQPQQITVIAMYTGQLLTIQDMMRYRGDELASISVRTVDDYQGEENHIIILSLVRSERAGFTANDERICVAMSRAKFGLFVLGNVTMLATTDTSSGPEPDQREKRWSKIYNKAQQKGLIDACFHLACARHENTVFRAVKPRDFYDFKCTEPCLMPRECGHPCPKTCHNEKAHAKTACNEPCPKKLKCGHPCKKKCSVDCTIACRERVKMTFTRTTSGCTHTINALCHQKPASHDDLMKLEKNSRGIEAICTDVYNPGNFQNQSEINHCLFIQLGACLAYCTEIAYTTCERCGSRSQVQCALRYTSFQVCKAECKKTMKCGHICKGTCISCCDGHIPCSQVCGQPLKCGHSCTSRCGDCTANGQHGTCNKKCPCELNCGHKCPGNCSDDQCLNDVHQQFACKHLCSDELSCGHNCLSYCGTCRRSNPIQHGVCDQPCQLKRKNCGHVCKSECHNLPPVEQLIFYAKGDKETVRYCSGEETSLCYARNGDEMSPCGHTIRRLCHQELLTNEVKEDESNWNKLLLNSCPVSDHQSDTQKRCNGIDMCLVACKKKIAVKCKRCTSSYYVNCYEEGLIDACKFRCNFVHPCGHKCDGSCSACKDGDHVACKRPCPAKLNCGHSCPGFCFDGECQQNIHKPCVGTCNHILACGHPCKSGVNCTDCARDGHAACTERCGRLLPCSSKDFPHPCQQLCHQKPLANGNSICPDPGSCFTMTWKNGPCKHMVSVMCHQDVWNLELHGLEKLSLNGPCITDTDCNHKPSVCNNRVAGRKCFAQCTNLRTIKCKKCRTSSENQPCNLLITECTSPCREKLACGHKCPGTCAACSAKSHQPCDLKCSATLECGHVCPSSSCQQCSETSQHAVCKAVCQEMKECGHLCQETCHPDHVPHEQTCSQPCTRKCFHGYPCDRRCDEECHFSKCVFECVETLFCGHKCKEKLHECQDSGKHGKCAKTCGQELSCGHRCAASCCQCRPNEDTIQHPKCGKICDRHLNKCDHKCKGVCGDCTVSKTHKNCEEKCEFKLLCGHPCQGRCGNCIDGHLLCDWNCPEMLICGHKCKGKCNKCLEDGHMRCAEVCQQPLEDCEHLCQGICGDCCLLGENLHAPCLKPCNSHLECEHHCLGVCSQCRKTGTHALCTELCGAPLDCQPEHICPGKCGDCRSNGHPPCKKKCHAELPCQHPCGGLSCGQCMEKGHAPCEKVVDSINAWKWLNGFVCGHTASDAKVQCHKREVLECTISKCNRKCLLRCSHGMTCKKKCGRVCDFGAAHNETLCEWGCVHSACVKTCNEPCSHLPCEIACPKKKKCENCRASMECFSFCGLACVTACKNCDSETYDYYKELGEVVRLDMDCNHIIAVEDVKYWPESWEDRDTHHNAPSTPFCPECCQPILNNRYFIVVARKAKWDNERTHHQQIEAQRRKPKDLVTAQLRSSLEPPTVKAQAASIRTQDLSAAPPADSASEPQIMPPSKSTPQSDIRFNGASSSAVVPQVSQDNFHDTASGKTAVGGTLNWFDNQQAIEQKDADSELRLPGSGGDRNRPRDDSLDFRRADSTNDWLPNAQTDVQYDLDEIWTQQTVQPALAGEVGTNHLHEFTLARPIEVQSDVNGGSDVANAHPESVANSSVKAGQGPTTTQTKKQKKGKSKQRNQVHNNFWEQLNELL